VVAHGELETAYICELLASLPEIPVPDNRLPHYFIGGISPLYELIRSSFIHCHPVHRCEHHVIDSLPSSSSGDELTL